MALRRKLPSRSTPDDAPESGAVAEKSPQNQGQNAPRQEARPPREPRRDAFSPAPEATPVAAPEPAAVATQSDAFAAASSSAFGTLPTAPRVLEDSFSVAPAITLPVEESTQIEPPVQIFEETPPVYVENMTIIAPVVEVVAAPAPQPEPISAAPAQPEPVMMTTPEPIVEAPVLPEPAAPEPITLPQPEPIVAAPEPTPAPAEEDVPTGPTDFMASASRPDSASIKRRIREKRPRDFSAMGAPENQQAERPKPQVAFAPTVPVDTRPLDKVDEDLIASGIVGGPAADSLTSALPGGAAEFVAERPAYVPPVPEPTPAPIASPVLPQPPAPAPAPAPMPEPTVAPAQPVYSAPPLAKPEVPAPQLAPANLTAPASIPSASFNLSNAPQPQPQPADLPPPQSDLPWTQAPATSNDWEIETPAHINHWETGAAADGTTGATAPSHMPPPADLYKPLAAPASPTTAMTFGAGLSPRQGTNFTPELPGNRRKSGGTPWALIVVAGLVAVGAGAYYFRSGGEQAQQQLANLTSGSSTPSADNNGLLPPPSATGTENASFYTPATNGAVADTSSSALVNFADVPASEVGQPIVADGTEQPPQDSGILAQLGSEVDKARAAKNGEPLTETPAAATAEVNVDEKKKDIQAEIAAYRSALAQSPNPAALTPSSFRKDPDGYMDGKTQQVAMASSESGEGTPTGSAALLPPPSGSGNNMLPPPELYTNNPKNLPVVSEPAANAPPRVRTLADFPDVEPYMPEKEKVEIPRNLKPKMAATDFPSVEVLSFVPGKGIVAYTDGREGVLLLGESLNGWELVNVGIDGAEFKAGEKSHIVTASN